MAFPMVDFTIRWLKTRCTRPDWTQFSRLRYTLRLVKILAALLPDESVDGPEERLEGGISTLPLSYKPWHSAGLAEAEGPD